ncbi:hypothetical protein IMZ11_02445 [Microtetraspora sp. AC03309]|uniref:hypothetical protein n=1 Tax=Microtetraspora sp. AC03309 TaxID=2779376 RepID=UPI001E52FD5E|nr:hypothetical protein [Microtetraspora sp. AC03309]MCC5574500.1 hypothetical protein [Microtetraspora sp. AC03309]
MSRTVHHVTDKHRDSTREEDARPPAQFWRITAPMAGHRIRSLRYSAAILRGAVEAGHRPRPTRVSRRLDAHTYPRTYGDRWIAYAANRQERALRAADRVAAVNTRHVLRAADELVDAAWDMDWPDPRHRHFAVWDSY